MIIKGWHPLLRVTVMIIQIAVILPKYCQGLICSLVQCTMGSSEYAYSSSISPWQQAFEAPVALLAVLAGVPGLGDVGMTLRQV